jgi:sigma-E factor negative regulatory protein RseC
MVTEEGIVETLMGRTAAVRIQRSSACSQCESRGTCHALSDKEMMLQVSNEIGAEVGDHVEVSLPGGSLVKLSLLVYLAPIVALILAASAAGHWSHVVGMESTLASILGGALGMGAAFYTLKRADRSAERNRRYHPRLTRILVSETLPPPDDSR